MELGNIQECYNELEEISPMYKTHRLALELRVKMYAKAEKWDHVETIAETLARLIKDSPFGVYNYCHSMRMQKRHEHASRPLEKACGKFPNHPHATNNPLHASTRRRFFYESLDAFGEIDWCKV